MKKFFFIAFLFSGSIIFAQNNNIQQSKKIKLEEAFKIQEQNCFLIEQLLIANLSDLKKETTTTEPVKSTFYKELYGLYQNFKSSDKNFQIKDLTPKDYKSIQDFYDVKLAKIDSLYKLRDTTIPVNFIEEDPTDIIKNGQISKEIWATLKEPMHDEYCKEMNPTFSGGCISFLFRRLYGSYYQIPEFRFKEHGVQMRIYLVLRVNRNGETILTHIVKSTNYFEFDMEAISATNSFSRNYKFTPARFDNKDVSVLYTCPLTISVAGTD